MIDLEKIDPEKLGNAIADAIIKYIKEDEKGRLWFVDKDGNKVVEIMAGENRVREKVVDDREVIKEASQMSLQKKEERLVINLPAWLKERLKKKSKRTGQSMNEIIRIALTEYLSK